MKKRLKRRRFTLAVLFAACILAFAAANPSSVEAASKPKQVKNVKVVKTTAHTVKIKFDKVEGAEYYQVRIVYPENVLCSYNDNDIYLPTENGGMYLAGTKEKLIYEGKTKKTSFTFKNLKCNAPHGVKVRAYKNGKYGKMSEEARCRTKNIPVDEDSSLEQVKGVKVIKTTPDTVKVKFDKVQGAEHYQILIFQDNVPVINHGIGLTPLIYAPKTKKTTYTIKHLLCNTPCTVKVRAYRNGKYGKMSKGAKCRTKYPKLGSDRGSRRRMCQCRSCGVGTPFYEGSRPGWDYTSYASMHSKAAHEVYGELHDSAGWLF